jgi:diguanylate cyclase (GGDEF)-like protein
MERLPGRLALLFVDLDHFKDVNDTFGHDVGDQVLTEVGRRLSRYSRHADTVARLGGDEFVVLCTNLREDDDLSLIADRIVEGVSTSYVNDGHDLSVTCSIGIAITSDPHVEPEQLIRDADEAMYEAKAFGRNRHRTFDPSQHIASTANRLKVDLSHAIDDGELFLLYQPFFSLEERTLVGVEALVRWRHPERGIVPPDEFVPFAEQHGLIGKIDSFVLDEACRQIAEWTHRGGWPSGFTMAVNVSGRELSDENFAKLVESAIRRHAVAPELICLEITETAFLGGWGEIQETLAALSSLGVRIALDDFGTGYSSLAHLQRMTVDLLKIDRSFVENIGRSERDHEIIAAVMLMAHALGISVVGEGIETDQQLDTLAGMECDLGQGFLLAKPMSADGWSVTAWSRLGERPATAARRVSTTAFRRTGSVIVGRRGVSMAASIHRIVVLPGSGRLPGPGALLPPFHSFVSGPSFSFQNGAPFIGLLLVALLGGIALLGLAILYRSSLPQRPSRRRLR